MGCFLVKACALSMLAGQATELEVVASVRAELMGRVRENGLRE